MRGRGYGYGALLLESNLFRPGPPVPGAGYKISDDEKEQAVASTAREIPESTRTPNAARVYDYLTGGKDNYDADRDLAGRMEAAAGDGISVTGLARDNRAFVLAATRWTASMLAIAQFADLGCGLPQAPAVHDAAREGCPEARVVYVDRDPAVIDRVAVRHIWPQETAGLAAVKADVADPARVLELVTDLEVPGAGPLIDLAQPACAILGGTLSAMEAATARNTVRGYAAALAPGSAVVISCASFADPDTGARIGEIAGAAGPWVNHDQETVASFFLAANLRVVRGQAGDVRCWPMGGDHAGDAAVIGGVGIRD